MQCTMCPTVLTGKQRRYCSPLCAARGFNAARAADGRQVEQRRKGQARSSEYHRRRTAGMTGRPIELCAACGGPTGKIAASEPGRRRVCSTMCRTYLQKSHWPASTVRWLSCIACLRTMPASSCDPHWGYSTCSAACLAVAKQAFAHEPAELRQIRCEDCDLPLTTNQPYQRYCSDQCATRSGRRRRRAREAGSKGDWRWSDFMRIARRFNYCCAYCGQKPDRLDADHVIALSRGGLNIITNLLPTCMACNSDKRDLTLSEWAADRQRRRLPPRTTTWGSEDNRYMHLTAMHAAA